jgi:hypothetical protein
VEMKKMQTAFAEKESEWRDQMTILKRELVAKDKKVQVTIFKLSSALQMHTRVKVKQYIPCKCLKNLETKIIKKLENFHNLLNSSL